MSEQPVIVDTPSPSTGAGAVTAPAPMASSNGHEVLLSVRDVTKYFDIRGGLLGVSKVASVRAVDGVSFDVRRGETLGLVGESGCGKTTLGKVILGLIPATSGAVKFKDQVLFDLPTPAEKKAGRKAYTIPGGKLKDLRKDVQVVFQDPYASLNPRMTVGEIVGEGPLVHGLKDKRKREAVVRELLGKVGLNQSHIHRYPHEFSGGQRQRIGIARALAVNPDFVVCDEPVSALDVSIQSQVLNLLDDLQREFGLTYLFIAHNLAVVEHISDRVGVMYLGKMVEMADVDTLYRDPRHPYTVALLSAIPNPSPRIKKKRLVLKGDIPSPANPPSGCRFHTRCWLRERLGNPENCATIDPDFRDIGEGHLVACHWAEEMSTVGREVKEAVGIMPRDPAAKGVPPASAPAPVPVVEVEERIPAPPTGPQKDLPLT
jgi:peptide/nickel transport system ATP-binding protein/oligopeptide transport system ATP-binding protein